jgi:hypothetical protein
MMAIFHTTTKEATEAFDLLSKWRELMKQGKLGSSSYTALAFTAEGLVDLHVGGDAKSQVLDRNDITPREAMGYLQRLEGNPELDRLQAELATAQEALNKSQQALDAYNSKGDR